MSLKAQAKKKLSAVGAALSSSQEKRTGLPSQAGTSSTTVESGKINATVFSGKGMRHEEFMKQQSLKEGTGLHMSKDGQSNTDDVDSPSHYNQSGIECIDAIRAALGPEGFKYYCQGNIIKYIWRYRYKNGVQDLKKDEWYLRELIKATEED